MTRLFCFLVVLVLAVAGGESAATATEEDAGGACTLDPVALPLFDATPAASIVATPASTGMTGPVDSGEIEAAVEMVVACLNTGEPRYVYAVFTERYLAEMLADPEVTYQPELERAIDQNVAIDSGIYTLEAIEAIEQQADGRVAVRIVLDTGVRTFTDTLLLAQVEDTWFIDGVVALDPPV
jgi:hypothetical protein